MGREGGNKRGEKGKGREGEQLRLQQHTGISGRLTGPKSGIGTRSLRRKLVNVCRR